jgi:hypothetical protein
MATVDDAVALLTDASLRAKGDKGRGRYALMRPTAIIDGLVELGANDRGEARALMIEGLDRIGGQMRPVFNQGGQRSGGRHQHAEDEVLVPRSALRNAG